MKYCVEWHGIDNDLLKVVDEINIELSRVKHLNSEVLKAFCEKHKEQRINLCIKEFESGINEGYIDTALKFQANYPEYKVYIRLPGRADVADKIKEENSNAKIFFNTYISSWDLFYDYIHFGVTDVYIAEEMCFELDKVSQIAKKNNINIRVFPNVTQSKWAEMNDLKKFWMRPEDVDIYEDFVDVLEFWGDSDKNGVYYDIYSKDKKWAGNLKEIIIGMKEDINSTCILPRFGERRVRCNKRCLKGGTCSLCDTIFELSKNLEKNNFRITYKKEKEKIEDGKRSSSES
jgi:hypothetical protein